MNDTVRDFRKHHLMEHTFKLIKIGCLNIKKEAILDRVADQFRQQKLSKGRAFCNNEAIQHQKTIESYQSAPNPKVTMQKIYTAWL